MVEDSRRIAKAHSRTVSSAAIGGASAVIGVSKVFGLLNFQAAFFGGAEKAPAAFIEEIFASS